MKRIYSMILCILIFSCGNASAYSPGATGAPLKYISSCELDFNNDNEPDIALLVETIKGRELIVLLRTGQGYDAFIVSKGMPNMLLSCHYGDIIKETTAGRSKGSVYRTSGTYIQLTQPEGSSVVYFWNKTGFKEVWTSD